MYIPTQYQRSVSYTLHCGVCFEELGDAVLHSSLLSCQHYFCNECWAVHLQIAVSEGLVNITCPEYECKKPVDLVFVMAMVQFSTYAKHEVHLTEYSLFSQSKANWCPTNGYVCLLPSKFEGLLVNAKKTLSNRLSIDINSNHVLLYTLSHLFFYPHKI